MRLFAAIYICVICGLKTRKELPVQLMDDHIEIRPLPDDPIEYLTGIFKKQPHSMADELLQERKRDNEIDEMNSL